MTSLTYEHSAEYNSGAYIEVGAELLVLLEYNTACTMCMGGVYI